MEDLRMYVQVSYIIKNNVYQKVVMIARAHKT